MRQTQWKKQLLAASIGSVLLVTSTAQAFAAATPKDIQGHWAQSTLAKWVQEGKIKGYKDGTLKPNNATTRAELIAMINGALQLQGEQEVTFKDVKAKQWFYKELRIAVANQYIGGFDDQTFRPEQVVTREQLAVILARLLHLPESDSANKYEDTKSLPAWSKGLIGGVLDKGLMSADSKKLFQPNKPATRAEVMVVLDRVAKMNGLEQVMTISKAGTYGPISGVEEVKGDIKVQVDGVILRNYAVSNQLKLTDAIGEGNVDLQGMTVKGSTIINGGGPNSIRVTDSSLAGVTVNKANGKIRIVAAGKSSVGTLTLESGAVLTESDLTGSGFGDIVITSTSPAGAVVQLNGQFDKVEIDAPGITIELTAGSSIGTLLANANVQITGKGTIDSAVIRSAGVKLEMKPRQIELAAGITATVNGALVSQGGGGGAFTGPGNNNGGGGDDGNPVTPPGQAVASEVFPTAASAQAGTVVTLSKAPSSGTNAWFAPTGTSRFVEGANMTKLTGDGSAVSLLAPSMAGGYKLYIVDSSGNVLSTSTAVLTVSGSVSNESASSLYPINRSSRGGATVTLTLATNAGTAAWFAPSGTASFEESAFMTQATGSSIAAPSAEGEYRLFLVKADGEVLNTSIAVLKVDNTAPSNDSVLANVTIKGGKSVNVGALGNDAVSAWIAPPGTTQFIEGPTMRQTTGSSLAAPMSEGVYKFYKIDAAGNISLPSSWTVTVDNTAPNNSNILLAASKSVKGGSIIALAPGIGANEQVWLAPAGTTGFTAGATMTTSPNGASLSAPTVEGVYHLFVLDEAGNLSTASNATVTVDNTAPTTQNSVFATDKTVSLGSNVALTNLPNGVTAWFAPAVTSVFAEGPAMTKSTGTGGSATIAAPATSASYKLFLIDAAGNISMPSHATLTVNP